jgi:hypothetical protein
LGHNLAQLGTASLDTFGGLVTLASPENVPEGASPRCFDVDFIVGSAFTRPGLVSVYTYSTTINISAVQIIYGTATFTYTGTMPVVNERLLLEGFTGSLTFLNGQTIVVESPVTATTFAAAISSGDIVLTQTPGAIAVSLTGLFVGPNVPTQATVISGGGSPWVSANNILGSTGYATASTGSTTVAPVTPGSAANDDAVLPWTNPSNLLSSSTFATRSLTTGQTSTVMLANNIGYNIPANAVVTGLSISFKAQTTGSAGSGSINLQLAQNGFPIGTAVNVPISSTLAPYSFGSNAYQWGTTLTPDIVNGSAFGILLDAKQLSGSGTFSINSLLVTLYYTTSSSSEALNAQSFIFTVPLTSGISGFGVSFQAYSTGGTTVTLQLLKAGVLVGTTKTQVLTSVPTIYSLGVSNDLWGSTWLASDVNVSSFGVQIVVSGTGTTFINDVDILTYITPALENFNYIKTYIQNDGQIDTLALDAAGIMWKEDVTNNEGALSVALTGILPGSFAKSATDNNEEFIMFSNLAVGTDRPRIFNGTQFLPLSMYAPGGQLSVTPTSSSSATNLNLTSYSVTSGTATFQYTGTEPVAGTVYVLSNIIPSAPGSTTDTQINNLPFVILSAGLTPTQFEISVPSHANLVSTALVSTATATLAQNFGVASIIQSYRFVSPPPPPTNSGSGSYGPAGTAEGPNPKGPWVTLLQSAGVGNTQPGSVVTVYYANASTGGTGIPGDDNLVEQMKVGLPTYVYISGAGQYNGTWQVTSVGIGIPPGGAGQRYYFTFNFTASGHVQVNGGALAGYQYQRSLTLVNTTTGIPNLTAGGQVTITGETPVGWNATWTIVQPLNSGTYNITNTSVDGTGSNVTFTYTIATGVAPKNGEIVKVTNTLVNTGTDLNGTYVINATSGTSPTGTFTVTAPAGAAPGNQTQTDGQAVVFGTQFLIDPGAGTVNTTSNPIFGNGGTGTLNVIGTTPGGTTQIAAGTRQAVAFFITNTGYETGPNIPIIFNVASGTNSIQVSGIPIGPPNVIARGIAFTEAGQNGVPGANFYVISNPVTQTIGTTTTTLAQSTIIRDNVTQSATFSFTDAVLLNSREIDVQGDNLFDLIELGSSAWAVPYSTRMFYGLQLNKVQNFQAMSFDSYIVPNQPAGWSAPDFTGSLVTSTVTGFAYAINNTTASTIALAGLIQQTAYQDAYGTPIIAQNITYSVRVAARTPTGSSVGNLVIDLSDGSTQYGSFIVPFSSLTTTTAVFSGTLLTTPFTNSVNQGGAASIVGSVPTTLVLRIYASNLGPGAGVEMDRVEVYPTKTPYIQPQVYGSYINRPESIDASANGGIIDTSTENAQACMGGFVMHDQLFLMKTSSMYSTESNSNSEPGGWGLHEVSNKVGSIGIHAYDTGEEWAVMACRPGIFGFNGGQPQKIMQEIYQIWDAINWDAGNTIVLRNDITNKRILCAIPLPTGTNPTTGVKTTSTKWLPNSPYVPAPTSPNVMLCLNYQGLGTFEELVSQAEMHTTMFGTLAAVDMKRKWTIWQIPSPYMDFITRDNGIDAPLFICNGINSSKVYELDTNQLSDDGVAIHSLYTTYGHVNAAKAATLPIFGFHAKRYTVFQVTGHGSGEMMVRILPNTLDARYPYQIPVGINLSPTENDDFFRPINVKAQRAFLEFSTNAVGTWFWVDKSLLTGKADAWSTLNPTGGNNTGITS